jgi:proline iminopeptidase
VYPDPPPFRTHALSVPGGHVLHVQESGNPRACAALVLHGGPGSGCSPLLRRLLDPARWRIVCIDQRGSGRSTPRGRTTDNTTADLLADLRRLRAALDIDRWLVVGGSWGAALALAHALDAPQAVAGLLLRASFVPSTSGIAAFFAARDGLPAFDLAGFAAADLPAQSELAPLWWQREQRLAGTDQPWPDGDASAALLDRYRVQAHYLAHGCWLDEPPLPERLQALPAVPIVMLHGSADRVCPPQAARALAACLPHAELHWVDGAGHDPAHPGMVEAMAGAQARLASVLGSVTT